MNAATASYPHLDPTLRQGVASVRAQVELAQEKGLALATCLAGTGISAAMLDDPEAEIDTAAEFHVVANILAALGDAGRGFGLEVGRRSQLTQFGIWGYALLCSPTLRDALELGLRHIDLAHAMGRVWTEAGERETSLYFDTGLPDPTLRIYATERMAAGTIALQREILGMNVPLYRLWFRHPRQAPAELYHAALGLEPEFERAANVGSFDTRLLELPLPRSDTLCWRMCEQQCRELVQQRRQRHGQAGRVRERLLADPARMPAFEQVAADLGLLPLKLRRQLAQEGTNFRALVDEVKFYLAEQILLMDTVSVQQAAVRLGYENSISFCQSFKRWTGMTPSRYIATRTSR